MIIDHSAYVLYLPNSFSDAFKTLLGEKVQVDQGHLRKATTSHERLSECGILSHYLQIADPFTFHLCLQEKTELRDYLMFRVKNGKTPYNDASCQFIKGKCEDISRLVSGLASDLPMEMDELMIRISNGILYANKGIKEDEQGHWDLFEQHYYMKTRGPLILEALQRIGFVLENDPIQYHKINPYNRRKHAWIISARKPAQERVERETAKDADKASKDDKTTPVATKTTAAVTKK